VRVAVAAGSRAVQGYTVAEDGFNAIAANALLASRWYALSCAVVLTMLISRSVGQWKLRSASSKDE
jgi:hypothetical protein